MQKRGMPPFAPFCQDLRDWLAMRSVRGTHQRNPCMPSLLLPQIKALLSDLSESCEVALTSDDMPYYPTLKWWLADGVFNLAPHGLFKTDHPYEGANDPRTVRDFLSQVPQVRFEGMHTLLDLFAEEVMGLLSGWAHSVLQKNMGDAFPSEDEWEQVYVPEWEAILSLAGLHPKGEGFWDEFLDFPLAVHVEPLRFAAQQMALQRRAKIARTVSRQDIESTMIQVISALVSQEQGNRPKDQPWAEWLMGVLDREQVRYPLEVAMYVHSTHFTRLVNPGQVRQFVERYPIPSFWKEGLDMAEIIGA